MRSALLGLLVVCAACESSGGYQPAWSASADAGADVEPLPCDSPCCLTCPKTGACWAEGDRCVPREDADCEAASACEGATCATSGTGQACCRSIYLRQCVDLGVKIDVESIMAVCAGG